MLIRIFPRFYSNSSQDSHHGLLRILIRILPEFSSKSFQESYQNHLRIITRNVRGFSLESSQDSHQNSVRILIRESLRIRNKILPGCSASHRNCSRILIKIALKFTLTYKQENCVLKICIQISEPNNPGHRTKPKIALKCPKCPNFTSKKINLPNFL